MVKVVLLLPVQIRKHKRVSQVQVNFIVVSAVFYRVHRTSLYNLSKAQFNKFVSDNLRLEIGDAALSVV